MNRLSTVLLLVVLLVGFEPQAEATYVPTPQKSWSMTVTGNFSQTIPDGITIAIFKSTILLGAGAITLPPNPQDGMPISIECLKGITLLSMSANVGQSVSNNFLPTTCTANVPIREKYSQTDDTWYPN